MDEVTQQNAALVEEAAAESLREQTNSLSKTTSVFKLGNENSVLSFEHRATNGRLRAST